MDAQAFCFSEHERNDKFFSSFYPVSQSGSHALTHGQPVFLDQLRAGLQAQPCCAESRRALLIQGTPCKSLVGRTRKFVGLPKVSIMSCSRGQLHIYLICNK